MKRTFFVCLAFLLSWPTAALADAAGVHRSAEVPGERTSSIDAVHALFDLKRPETGPFPSDLFTVPDPTQNTGRRVTLPYPDCSTHRSDCDDLDVINTLDGFGLQPQLSIPFDGPIDVATANSKAVFLLKLGSTVGPQERSSGITGIDQVVWDSFTDTLHVEVAELLEQHTRYALVVTNRVRDANGKRVKASDAFRKLHKTGADNAYGKALRDAIEAAKNLHIDESTIVSAAVFTTQSITSVMEAIRHQIKSNTPAPANFRLGPAGERSVFHRQNVASISWTQHSGVAPVAFRSVPIDLAILQVVPGAVATIAYGYYVAPDYHLHPGEYIPAVGTRTGVPVVQRHNEIHFTLYLPSGPRPPAGWPIALVGGGGSGNQHGTSGNQAAKLAANGIATIGINHVGQGFGPLGSLRVTKTDGSFVIIPNAGRGIDQNGDNLIGNTEGSEAAAPRTWTISASDSTKQTVIDFMQLVRVIEVGMDVDGDNIADIDASRIYFFGVSAGSLIGTIFMALEPSVRVAVAAATPGVIPEHARWQPNRRPQIGLALQGRTPSLINAPGLTQVDGVAVLGPHYNENKPLRNQPPVINTIAGAIEIQKALEHSEMASQSGLSAVVWIRHLRTEPLPGVAPKSVIYQFAKGDQQSVNPGSAALIRTGNLADRTLYYRHDLAFAQDPAVPKNPHTFSGSPTHPNALFRSISRGAQDQIGTFFRTDGQIVIHPEPAYFFEVPVTGPLPEDLNLIP